MEIVEKMIEEFVATWRVQEPAFEQYFSSNYVSRKKQWAVCYLDSSIPDTTAHAEAFHNVLKRVYSSKRNRNIKDLISKLMTVEEDYFIKYHGYIRKYHRSKWSDQRCIGMN